MAVDAEATINLILSRLKDMSLEDLRALSVKLCDAGQFVDDEIGVRLTPDTEP